MTEQPKLFEWPPIPEGTHEINETVATGYIAVNSGHRQKLKKGPVTITIQIRPGKKWKNTFLNRLKIQIAFLQLVLVCFSSVRNISSWLRDHGAELQEGDFSNDFKTGGAE